MGRLERIHLVAEPGEDVVLRDPLGHGLDAGPAVVLVEGQCVLDDAGQPLDVERVAGEGLAQFLRRSGELGEDEGARPPARTLADDELLRDEVHPIAQRRDETDVREAVVGQEPGR